MEQIYLNEKDKDGNTALILASSNGNVEVVKYLIDSGANVNIKNNECKTALDLAEENGYEEIAEILKNAGAKHSNEI